MITQEQLKELQQRKEDLKRYLDIDSKKIEVEEEELRTHVPLSTNPNSERLMTASWPRVTEYQALPPSTPTVTVSDPSGELTFTSLALAATLNARHIKTTLKNFFILFRFFR